MKPKTAWLCAAIVSFAAAFIAAWGIWSHANAEVITWDNPTVYEDGVSIPAADIAALGTVIEIKGAGEADAWQILATVSGGLNTWTGSLPAEYSKGSSVSVRYKSSLHGLESAYADAISYTIPYVAPCAPSNMMVITVTTSR